MTSEIIRIFILLAIFAAVFLIIQVVGTSLARNRTHRGAVNRRLQMIASGEDREAVIGKLVKNRPTGYSDLPIWLATIAGKIERMVFVSGATFTTSQLGLFILIGVVALFVITMLIVALTGTSIGIGVILLVTLFSLAAAVGLPLMILSRMADLRRKRMEHQFPVALDIFVRALRSGHPVAAAIDLLTREMEDPIGTEFGLISDEVAYGADLVASLEHMADRWDLDDMKMFVVSLSVQSQTGGNLAEILDNISKVIRERHQMFLKVKALSSEGRMTAWMLSVLPILAFVSIFLVTPQYYLDTSEDPIFLYGFITLIIMYLVGVYIIRRLVDIKV